MIQIGAIYWDPQAEAFRIPFLDVPILWYGVLFAIGFAVGFLVFANILTRFLGASHKQEAFRLADQLLLYVILGTIIGARLGHLLFYERPESYLRDPLEIFRIREGGLASHGGAIGVILALIFFSLRIKKKELSWIRLLDFACIPAAFVGFCIRIGNFINQEILGKPTYLPWGVIFGHPADRGPILPRHPVQIYEALFYLAVFFFLYRLSFQNHFLKKEGKLSGIFLILVFGFRFFIETFKTEQSRFFSFSLLTMGQLLSIPLFFLGIFLLSRNKT